MVKYQLIQAHEKKLEYAYYPEGVEDENHGVITVDFRDQSVLIDKVAASDEKVVVETIEKLNAMRDAMNEKRRKKGKPEFTEEEWPTATEPQIRWKYADKVVTELSEKVGNGETPENGIIE